MPEAGVGHAATSPSARAGPRHDWVPVNFHPGAFVSLLTVPGITKGVVLRADGHFVRVRWITRPFMEGKESTHREEDLYKLAYRVSPHPDRDQERNDEVRPSA
jgi:hypothetical protein